MQLIMPTPSPCSGILADQGVDEPVMENGRSDALAGAFVFGVFHGLAVLVLAVFGGIGCRSASIL